MGSRPSTALPILTVLAIVLVTLGAYTGGYFWRSELWKSNGQMHQFSGDEVINLSVPITWERDYRTQWEAAVFKPAGKVEGWLRGIEVEVKTIPSSAPFSLR